MTDLDTGAGADLLQLDPASAPARGLTGWLVDAVRAAIADGRLAAGTTLPATRVLAADLQVSRGVVVEAYRRLTDEGLVSGHRRGGTTIRPLSHAAGEQAAGPDMPEPSSGTQWSPTAPLLPIPPGAYPQTVEIDLSPGVPDLSAFPRAAWLRAERAVLQQAGTTDLGYGDPRGRDALRRELAGWLARTRGLRAEADDIIVVSGVAQALALLAQVLHRHGATAVAVEDPGSRGARDDLAHWGLRPVPVPVDGHGLRTHELAGTAVTAAMLTPAHQFPTGVVLAPERRRELLDWAAAGPGRLIIEDDYDAEYRYDRAPVPALQAAAPDLVAHTGSTSKTLAPAMRLGWLVPPRRLRADLIAAKHASDLGSPALPQLVLARLIGSGEYDRHIRLVRARQRSRRDALLGALREHLPRAQVRGIAAGLHLLITLPNLDADDVELAGRIGRDGVLVHPLSWHRDRPGPPGLILGYAAHPPDRLRTAARRIGGALAGVDWHDGPDPPAGGA